MLFHQLEQGRVHRRPDAAPLRPGGGRPRLRLLDDRAERRHVLDRHPHLQVELLGDAGIDDAHFFQTHDLDQALAGLAPQRCAVLLSHTPQPYRQAAAAGVQLMLSGHTHGGQVCLPGGIPILTDTPAPRFVVRGAWNYQGMAGYTSVGCGSSVVDVRLNCLPEITLHQLRRRASAAPEKD